jgi:excisionase family DNA binding protein
MTPQPDISLPLSADSECMRADQLARFLGVNRKTVYEYAARNVIPHRRLGRRIVFSRAQVVAWLGACRASPAGKAI